MDLYILKHIPRLRLEMNFKLKSMMEKFPLIPTLKKAKNILLELPKEFEKIKECLSKHQVDTLDQYRQLYSMISELQKSVKQNQGEILTIKESLRLHNLEQNQKHEKVILDLRETLTQHNLEQNQKRMASEIVLSNTFKEQLNPFYAKLDLLSNNSKELYKGQIHSRWFLADYIEHFLQKENRVVTCPVCRYSSAMNLLQKRESACIFEGGRLSRFECPVCGCVFGPQKMLDLTENELGEEYKISYKVFAEADTSVLENAVFQTLLPDKKKIYLNWGAGAWNSTSEKLRREGFHVYDYEPYAPCKATPWLITAKKDLFRNKFDGIFSNDLIEHLPHPVEDLLFMKSLLKDNGIMAHGSGCYEYAFEYTRFHLCFFLGRSLEYISKKLEMDYELSERYAQTSPFRVCKWTMKKKEYAS